MPLTRSVNWRQVYRYLYRTHLGNRQTTRTRTQIQSNSTPGKSSKYGGILLLSFIPAVKLAHCAANTKQFAEISQSLFPDLGPISTMKDLIKIADLLYDKHRIEDLYTLLKDFGESDNADLLWRVARALYEKSQASTLDAEKKQFMYAAFAASKRAVAGGEANFAVHKWYAILLDEIGKYEGTKFRLQKSPEVKEHFEKAISLNPTDPTSHHCLGYWHYSFADLAWYQRQAAAAFFAAPPKSTYEEVCYEEAVKCFQHAEEVQPNFYSMNLLMLGKSYMKIHDYKQAVVYLTKLKEYHAATAEDRKAMDEGGHLLQEAMKKTTP